MHMILVKLLSITIKQVVILIIASHNEQLRKQYSAEHIMLYVMHASIRKFITIANKK